MKVLLLNSYATGGGAAVAARRMLDGLLEQGIEARLLTAFAPSEDITYAPEVLQSLYRTRYSYPFILERLQLLASPYLPYDKLFRFSTATFGVSLLDHPWVEWADVIHIHWVQHGFLSLTGIEKLLALKGKRFYWTLHDLWPLTGGCHVPYLTETDAEPWCRKYLVGCSECPLMVSNGWRKKLDTLCRALFRRACGDTHIQWQHKQHLHLERVQFLGVSTWVTKEINYYLSQYHSAAPLAYTLPNSYNPALFTPQSNIRQSPTKIPYKLLFVAARIDDPVKGLDYLRTILQIAATHDPQWASKAELHLVGNFKQAIPSFPISIVHHARLPASVLATLYRQVDLTLSTSRFETFGQTLLESIASGTPAIAFDVGGTSDIIHNGVNGVLIPPYDLTIYAHHLTTPLLLSGTDSIASSVRSFQQREVIKQLLYIYGA